MVLRETESVSYACREVSCERGARPGADNPEPVSVRSLWVNEHCVKPPKVTEMPLGWTVTVALV